MLTNSAPGSLHTPQRGWKTLTLLLWALSIIDFSGTAYSQSGVSSDPSDVGNGGKNTIEGKVYYPGGRKVDRRIKVRLASSGFGEQIATTDDNGAFMFRRLRGGSYTLTLDAGGGFEQARETVDIIEPGQRQGDRTGQTYTVQISLQPSTKPVKDSSPGTVSASATAIPEPALKLYKSALEAAKDGKPNKAIEDLKSAINIYPSFVPALNELGVQYLRLNQMDKARDQFQAALKIDPNAFAPRLNYGIALVQLKDYKEGATQLQQALQKDSGSGSGHLFLGRALVQLGDDDGAQMELETAIGIGGNDVVEAHRYLGVVLMDKKQNARAADELQKYLSLAPKAKDANQIQAIIKQLRGQAGKN
jgi:Tfp pilus assembly protein PilF